MEGLRLEHSPSKQSFEISFVDGHCGGHDVVGNYESEYLQSDSLNGDCQVRDCLGAVSRPGGGRP